MKTTTPLRYASFETGGKRSWGVVRDDGVVDLGARFGDRYAGLKAVVAADFPSEVAEAAGSSPADLAVADIAYLPPIADPLHIWCLAINYVEHHAEVQRAGRVQDLPKEPAVFSRTIDSFVGHEQNLWHPQVSEQFDYEGELAVVIGRRGHRIRAEDAFAHVAGYTVLNDGSVRDWQFHTRQITPGKNFYRSGSIGPWIVRRDDMAASPAELDSLRIKTTLNGAALQDDVLGSMVHKIPRFIEYVSAIAPLEPGDILATGTPSGVGFSRKPPVWMKPDDVCEITIERVGVLRNRVARG